MCCGQRGGEGGGAHIVGLISVLWTVGGGAHIVGDVVASIIRIAYAKSFFIVDIVCPYPHFYDVFAASILHSSS